MNHRTRCASLVGAAALAGCATATTPATPPPPRAVVTYTGFAKPESILYDAAHDRYLVSNINGTPGAHDNNGFISILSPDGQVTQPKWIEGGKHQVTLDAPTGSAIANGILYVADLTTVRRFDLETGASNGDIAIPGATLLNDVAAAPDGRVYVDDSGFTFSPTGDLQPTGTDAVYVIENGQARVLVQSPALKLPNGLAWTRHGLVVCASGAAEVYRLDENGNRREITITAPGGRLDGLVALGDELLVTSHEASAVLHGTLGGRFDIALPALKAPADIGYDTKRGRILVPHVLADTVDVYELR